MAKKGAKKAAAEAPAPKKATTISASVDMQFPDLVGMLLQILHLLITTFSYTTLWMQPSGLSHLRLFPTETGVRYFVKSFVLCAEGHRHPQQGWVAARADYWPLKANKAYVRKKWFIILWIAREIMKPSSKCEPELFPLLSNTPPAIWAEQIFIPEIVFFSLVRISALKFSGLRAHFSSAVAGWTLRSQLDNPGMKYVARIPWLLMKAKKA